MRRLQASQSLAFAAGAPAARKTPRAAVARAVFPRNEPSLNEIGFIRLPPGAWPGLAIGMHPKDSNTCLNERFWWVVKCGQETSYMNLDHRIDGDPVENRDSSDQITDSRKRKVPGSRPALEVESRIGLVAVWVCGVAITVFRAAGGRLLPPPL